MKTLKSQVSLEYIIFFNIALVIFLVIGTILVSGIEKARKTEFQAKYLAKDIKSQLIIASLSYTDFNSSITIRELDSGNNICVGIYGDPDNMILIKESIISNNQSIAREFLPLIHIPPEIPVGSPLVKCSLSENIQDRTLTITKKGNIITLS